MTVNRNNISFLKSAAKAGDFPDLPMPQLGVAGRSNVGKSSLINGLFGRKRLARVSGSPGATRLINFFLVDDAFLLADLPGYGYAKRSRTERGQWRRLVESYLATAGTLTAMLVLVDVRRGAEAEERSLIETLLSNDISPVVVLTKADKLAKSKRQLAAQKLGAEFARAHIPTILFSSKTGEGRERLWQEILAWLENSYQ